MSQAALVYRDNLENQGVIDLTHSTIAISIKSREAQAASSWFREFIAAIPARYLLSGVEASLRASLARAMSALPMFEGLAGFRFSTGGHEEDLVSEDISPCFPSSKDEISPDAEEYARPLGIYGSLLRAQEMVWGAIPGIRRLRIERYDDPDEGGYPLIRLEIVTSKLPKEIAIADDELQRFVCRKIPVRHQPYFAFTYQFEK